MLIRIPERKKKIIVGEIKQRSKQIFFIQFDRYDPL